MNNPSFLTLRALCLCVLTSVLVACQANLSDETEVIEVEEAVAVETAVAEINNTTRPKPRLQPKKQIPEGAPPITDLWDRIRAGLQLQDYYDHPDVTRELQEYATNQAFFDLTIERARPFLYSIVLELERRDLPQELALLPFVESAFNPTASSNEQAVGLWQFMGATASSFGLQSDWWYDARRDPHASTLAALDYLEELVVQFEQDWLLALAAYNAGDGNVRRAIRRNKSDAGDSSPFWDLRLPAETRAHVPKVLALARLVNDTDNYDIVLSPIANSEPLARVDVGAQIDLAQAAQLAAIEYDALRNLNPGYLQWATHPEQPQFLLLPHAQAQLLEAGLKTVAPSQLLTWDQYQIRAGDTLSKIARNLGTSVAVLQRVNNLRGSQIIAGETLLIPRGPDADSATTNPYAVAAALYPPQIPSNYRIRSGDSLWSIARRFDLHSSDIALWNGIEIDAILRPGQIINLSPGSPASGIEPDTRATTYVVRKGDSLDRIASRFDTDLDTLLENNQLDAAAIIYPGQVIQISPPQNGVN